jgi:hypothetical protein
LERVTFAEVKTASQVMEAFGMEVLPGFFKRLLKAISWQSEFFTNDKSGECRIRNLRVLKRVLDWKLAELLAEIIQ